ncbi:MAG: tRNA (adenosine(37)-N6)-threonylcarbamoyltransferase complex dimerization subunit type 1 TsaB [Patescibacteria group bacterium]|jgi:tRNA threonylcarbamoyladenosine biosynthesis protein TsaB
MYLIINTTDDKGIEIFLVKDKVNFWHKKIIGERKQSEKLLVGIEKIITTQKIKFSQLKGIGVVSGPGGFTSVRIGVVVANTLGYAWKVPVAGIRKDEFENNDDLISKLLIKIKKVKKGSIVLPFYDREPNIT